jgi:6-phosphogluconolactonase (cycloisomerase 2 family)
MEVITEMRHQLPRAKHLAICSAALAGLGLAIAPAVAGASPTTTSPVVGNVYVNDNTTGVNTIAGFARHADATLTPLAGSPFVAGGNGTGSGLASQGALQITPDGKFVVAVDAGSNQISVLKVESDGSLKLLPGGVVSSEGSLPVSIAIHDNLVYVANAGPTGSNYTGFTLSPSGHLSPLPGSTVSLPDGSQPGDVSFNSTGANLIGARVGTSLIDSFSVGSNGLLTAAPTIAAQATGPFGSEFNPADPSQLFVSNAHQGPLQGSVSAFTDAADGTLSAVSPTPAANGQSGTCWVDVNNTGTALFAVNTGSGTVSSYSIGPNGALTLVGNTPVSAQAGVGAVDLRLGPAGKTLWVDESKADAIGVFAVVNGTGLSELAPVALPAGAAAAGIVVT